MQTYSIIDKQIAITAALAGGSCIRAIERMTGVHRDTIMRLAVRIGLVLKVPPAVSPLTRARVAHMQELRDAETA